MANNIPTNVLKQFILDKVGNKLNFREAQELKVEDTYKEVLETVDDNDIDIEDIMDSDLCEKFAVIYFTDMEKKQEAKDKEKQKEENLNVKSGNNSSFN